MGCFYFLEFLINFTWAPVIYVLLSCFVFKNWFFRIINVEFAIFWWPICLYVWKDLCFVCWAWLLLCFVIYFEQDWIFSHLMNFYTYHWWAFVCIYVFIFICIEENFLIWYWIILWIIYFEFVAVLWFELDI